MPWLTLTTELRARRTDEGDRFLRALDDPANFVTQTEKERRQLTIGGRARLGPGNDLLFFGSIAEEEILIDSDQGPFLGIVNTEQEIDSITGEIQHTTRFDWGHILFGASVTSLGEEVTLGFPGFGAFSPDFREIEQMSGYGYAFIEVMDGVDLTLGLSLDRAKRTFFKNDPFFGNFATETIREATPKLGIEVEPVDGVRLRAAYARTLKRELVQDRTLEPTTIAGFNQFFDDFPQTNSEMIGGGADIRVLPNVWVGGEAIYRELEIPALAGVGTAFLGSEKIARGYANATWGEVAGSLGVEFIDADTDLLDRPDNVRTLQIPLSVRYFHDSSVFVGAEAIWFEQESEGLDATGLLNVNTNEEGLVVNAVAGYRLPNGRGIASLEVNNLLDQSFALQNDLNNSARPGTRPLSEELSVFGRLTLSF